MIASLLRVLQPQRWQLVRETPSELVVQANDPLASDFDDSLPFVAAGQMTLTATVELGVLYQIEVSGYPLFNQDLDDEWSTMFGQNVEAVKRHRRRLAAMRQEATPLVDVFRELEQLHSLALESGSSVTCRMVVSKNKLAALSPGERARSFVWFSSERFKTWIENSTFHECLQMFGDPIPPIFWVVAETADYPFDMLVRPLRDLQQPLDPGLPAFWSQHARLYRAKKKELSLESNMPAVHPFMFYDVSSRWWEITKFRLVVAYAVLCLFSSEVTSNDAGYDFVFTTSAGFKTATVTFVEGGLSIAGATATIALSSDLLQRALDVCKIYLQSLSESDSLRGVWSVVLERATGERLGRILTDPDGIVRSFRELKDTLLKSNIEKLLSTHEKAQGAVIQAAAQITKEVDGLGADVEKAVLAGVGSGVLALLGTLLKTPSIDLAAPVAVGLLATLFFPNVFSRLEYFEQSLRQRSHDLRLFLDTLTSLAKESVNLDPYVARFDDHFSLAMTQIKAARSRMSLLFMAVHSLVVLAVTASLWRFPSGWSTLVAAAITALYSLFVVVREQAVPAGIQRYLSVTPFLLFGLLLLQRYWTF